MSGNPAVDPENGGYTVPTTVATTILDALKAYGGMRQVATIIRMASGEPMQFPTSDGTSEEGEIVAENQSASDEDITFGTKGLPVYKYSSKVVTVPWELLGSEEHTPELQSLMRISYDVFCLKKKTKQKKE